MKFKMLATVSKPPIVSRFSGTFGNKRFNNILNSKHIDIRSGMEDLLETKIYIDTIMVTTGFKFSVCHLNHLEAHIRLVKNKEHILRLFHGIPSYTMYQYTYTTYDQSFYDHMEKYKIVWAIENLYNPVPDNKIILIFDENIDNKIKTMMVLKYGLTPYLDDNYLIVKQKFNENLII